MVAAAAGVANGAEDQVPIRNRAMLVCGVGLAALTVLAVVVAMIVALAR